MSWNARRIDLAEESITKICRVSCHRFSMSSLLRSCLLTIMLRYLTNPSNLSCCRSPVGGDSPSLQRFPITGAAVGGHLFVLYAIFRIIQSTFLGFFIGGPIFCGEVIQSRDKLFCEIESSGWFLALSPGLFKLFSQHVVIPTWLIPTWLFPNTQNAGPLAHYT